MLALVLVATVSPALPAQPEPQRPYSCWLLHDEAAQVRLWRVRPADHRAAGQGMPARWGAAVKAFPNDIALLNGPSVTITCISSGLQAVLGPIYDTPMPLARSIGWSWGSTRYTSRQSGKPFSLSRPML